MKKSLMLFMGLTVCINIIPISKCRAQSGHSIMDVNRLWKAKETFKYNVKYSFFDLGTIWVHFDRDTLYRGHYYRLARVIARSNPGLPFVGNKEDHFTSFIAKNDTMFYDTYYWKDDIDEHVMKKDLYILNYKEGKVFTFKKGEAKDTLNLDKPSMCGIAYFFFTRIYAGSGKTETVPVYIDRKESSITLHSSTKKELIDNAAFPGGKVPAFVSTGEARFDGPFGFKGKYKAWYTTDPKRIPVQAYVRVWLGNVKIRLVSYSSTEF